MTIQAYQDELDYVNAKLREAGRDSNSFLSHFLEACLRADWYNFQLLHNTLRIVMQKYPARAELLELEKRDRA